MNPTGQTSATADSPAFGAPLTRPQRRELLRMLILGRGLERVLAGIPGRPRAGRGGDDTRVLTAIAAAAAIEPGDRLVVPHDLLAAHLVAGVGPREIATARLREPSLHERQEDFVWRGIGPQSAAGIGAGVALGISLDSADRGRPAALALIDRRWVPDDACRGALSLAGELALPLVVVAIDPGTAVENGSPVVDRDDFEWVRAAVAEALSQARDDRRSSLVECAGIASPESAAAGRVVRFGTRRTDPLGSYERTLMINGLSRIEIDEVKRAATDELEDALADRIGAPPAHDRADAESRPR